MSVFGPLLPSLTVERAAKATLQLWMRDYLGEVCDQDGLPRGFLQAPLSYPIASQIGRAEDKIPVVGIHVPGMTQDPYRHSDGVFWTKWRLEIGATVSANTQENTDRMAKLYGAAIWGCLMQNPDMGGRVEHTTWLTEDYGLLPAAASKDRSLAFALLTFEVELRDSRSSYGGPITPTTPPPETDVPVDYGNWPTVESVDVGVEAVTQGEHVPVLDPEDP
ncbi:MAG: hypothetical protein JWM31_1261 [Solirubrobacterales bacterium]|nr:hypothetical protein [Solirubrobacterales bacterium]